VAIGAFVEMCILKSPLIFNSSGNRPLEPRPRNLKKYLVFNQAPRGPPYCKNH